MYARRFLKTGKVKRLKSLLSTEEISKATISAIELRLSCDTPICVTDNYKF